MCCFLFAAHALSQSCGDSSQRNCFFRPFKASVGGQLINGSTCGNGKWDGKTDSLVKDCTVTCRSVADKGDQCNVVLPCPANCPTQGSDLQNVCVDIIKEVTLPCTSGGSVSVGGKYVKCGPGVDLSSVCGNTPPRVPFRTCSCGKPRPIATVPATSY